MATTTTFRRRRLTLEDLVPTPSTTPRVLTRDERRRPENARLRQLHDDAKRAADALHAERLRLGL